MPYGPGPTGIAYSRTGVSGLIPECEATPATSQLNVSANGQVPTAVLNPNAKFGNTFTIPTGHWWYRIGPSYETIPGNPATARFNFREWWHKWSSSTLVLPWSRMPGFIPAPYPASLPQRYPAIDPLAIPPGLPQAVPRPLPVRAIPNRPYIRDTPERSTWGNNAPSPSNPNPAPTPTPGALPLPGRPPANTIERKRYAPGLARALAAATEAIDKVGELKDAVDIISDSIKGNPCKGLGLAAKTACVIRNIDGVDWSEAIPGLIVNHIEDQVIGKFLGQLEQGGVTVGFSGAGSPRGNIRRKLLK